MSIIWRIFAAIAAVLAIVFGSVAFAWPSLADPTTQQTYSGVGSNTTQDVIAALANQTVQTPAGDPDPTMMPPAGTLSGIGSYEVPNGNNSANITLTCKSGTPPVTTSITFTRPNGSGAGLDALSASLDPSGGSWTFTNPDGSTSPQAIPGCLQFASVDSGPSPAAGPGVDPLTYVPFARDAVGYIYVGSSALGSLNQTQLTEIYEGQQPISGITVTPYLPQAGSGTRNFFLGLLGNPTLGSDVNQGTDTQVNEENTASVIGSLPAGTNAIYPFSISSWVAQSNGFSSNTGTSAVTLGNPAVGDSSDFIDPVGPGAIGQIAPNPSFYSTPFGRDVYNVVSTDAVTDFINGTPDDYTDLLNQIASTAPVLAGATTPAIASPASLTIIHDFGFLSGAADGYAYDDEVGVSTAPTGPYTFVSS